MYGLAAAPQGQAQDDLNAAGATPGRYLLGIVRRVDAGDAEAGAELIGLLDFRLHWPEEGTAYVGMLLVAEPYGSSPAWRPKPRELLAPWLAATAKVRKVRTGVEQFNIGALKFWQRMGLRLTGDSDRIRSGDTLCACSTWSNPSRPPDSLDCPSHPLTPRRSVLQPDTSLTRHRSRSHL